jgi:hypothetical protein
MAALLPGRLRIDGQPAAVAVSGDFSIERAHRGLGPALALQRGLLGELGAHGLLCAYGCPNAESRPVVRRVGYGHVGELTRFVKVLRTRLVIEQFVRRRRLARILSGVATVTVDPVLRVLTRERRARRAGLTVVRPPRFDERFAGVWAAMAERHRITGERSAEHLNWRYDLDGTAPSTFSIFAVAGPGDDAVAGYVVHQTSNDVRHVFDLACRNERDVVDALLAAFVADARGSGCAGISFRCLGEGPVLAEGLRRAGFVARPGETGLQVYANRDDPPSPDLLDARHWYFVMGDTDL